MAIPKAWQCAAERLGYNTDDSGLDFRSNRSKIALMKAVLVVRRRAY